MFRKDRVFFIQLRVQDHDVKSRKQKLIGGKEESKTQITITVGIHLNGVPFNCVKDKIMFRSHLTILTAFLSCLTVSGFVVNNRAGSLVVSGNSNTQLHAKTTLTDETNWKLRIVLNGAPTEKGRKVDELFVVEAQFIEEEGYEPPQGSLRQIFPEDADSRVLKIEDSYWKLSEDPNERKDGLWVWGLFKEPLYPFLLLQMKTEKVPIPGEEEDFVKPLTLFAQINHSRDDEKGVVLKAAVLNVREMETVNADVFGTTQVEVFEEIQVGQISILPVEEDAKVASNQ